MVGNLALAVAVGGWLFEDAVMPDASVSVFSLGIDCATESP